MDDTPYNRQSLSPRLMALPEKLELTIRQRVAFYLDDTSTPAGRAINGAIALLILVSSALFVAETYELSAQTQQLLRWADWTILSLFTLEYGLRLWSAERRVRYGLSFYAIADLIAILPFWLGFLDSRFIRLLRWLRILRLVRFVEDRALLGAVTTQDGLIFVRILFTLVAIIFIYSGLIFQVEHVANPEGFQTLLDAVYFAVVTMTTVGFGDVTPISETGRGLTVLMILTGIALIPTQIGNLIQQLGQVNQSIRQDCQSCGLSVHQRDARFCRRCGAALAETPPDLE
ncbi:MAG: potassium channel family protein [Cyanobacteria bacterium P01_H01_bin.119]